MEHQPYSSQKQSWHVVGGFILSACIHVMALLQLSQMDLPGVELPHQVTFVEVQLVSMAIAQEAPQASPPDELKPQENVEQEATLPESEQTKRPEKKAVVEKPKPVKKIVKKPFRKVLAHSPSKKTQPPSKLITASVSSASKSSIAQAQVLSMQQVNQAKEQYLSHLMSVIRAHKIYPYSARRRHIEGDIDVSFIVDSYGHISQLHITGGSAALRAASKRAIEDSLPFPVPPKLLAQSLHPKFIMQYRLK